MRVLGTLRSRLTIALPFPVVFGKTVLHDRTKKRGQSRIDSLVRIFRFHRSTRRKLHLDRVPESPAKACLFEPVKESRRETLGIPAPGNKF